MDLSLKHLHKRKRATVVHPEVMPKPGKTGLHTNLIDHISKHLLEKVRHEEFAIPFMKPVDTEAVGVPDYYQKIQQPMDFGTIIARVENRYYHSVTDLNKDIMLVLNNCFAIDWPDATMYKSAHKLGELFHKAMKKMTHEEIPYSMEKGENSTTKHQCSEKLERLQENIEQFEPDVREFFQDKLSGLSEKLQKCQLKTVDDFDTMVTSSLKQSMDNAKRIFDSFEKDSKQSVKKPENEHVSEQLAADPNAKSKWLDNGLFDTLDKTVTCLEQDLAIGRRNKQQSYTEVLRQKFVDAQIINVGDCPETLKDDPSVDEKVELQSNIVSEEERRSIHVQFDKLSPEAMGDIMEIIKKSEHGCKSNNGNEYNVMHFKPETVTLIKKAIHSALHSQDGPDLVEIQHAETECLQLTSALQCQEKANPVEMQYAEAECLQLSSDSESDNIAEEHSENLDAEMINQDDFSMDSDNDSNASNSSELPTEVPLHFKFYSNDDTEIDAEPY